MTAISQKRRIWGWMMFDWASQPFYTLLLTFIFGPYFAAVAAEFYMTGGLDETTADAELVDGVLTLRIDLRPSDS